MLCPYISVEREKVSTFTFCYYPISSNKPLRSEQWQLQPLVSAELNISRRLQVCLPRQPSIDRQPKGMQA